MIYLFRTKKERHGAALISAFFSILVGFIVMGIEEQVENNTVVAITYIMVGNILIFLIPSKEEVEQ